jgi:hypothetical protein
MIRLLLQICSGLLLGITAPGFAAGAFSYPETPYTSEDLVLAKQRALAGRQPWADALGVLFKEADEALKRPVSPGPETLFVPRRYEDPAGHLKAREKIGGDAWAAYALALASRLGDDDAKTRAYAEKAAAILKSWTSTKDIGTYDPDHPSPRREAALTACTAGNGLIAAAELLHDNPHWSADGRAAFLEWTKRVYYPATEIRTIDYDNNWNCWGIYAHLLASHFTGDREGFAVSTTLLKHAIVTHIENDGRMPKELARGTGKHWYTYYALTPLTLGAYFAGNVTGENLLDPATITGARLASGMRYFVTQLEWQPYRDLVESYGGLTGDLHYLSLNRGKRPVVGIRAHGGWNFPTLFIKTDEVPVNDAPRAVARPDRATVSIGDEIEFDAAGSTDADGEVRRAVWSYPAKDEAFEAGSSLAAPGDAFVFPKSLRGDFTLSLRMRFSRTTNMAVALQSEEDTEPGWKGSSYLIGTKDGHIQVRDGSGYRSDHEVVCKPGDVLTLRMRLHARTRTYDVFADTGAGEVQLAEGYAIRDDKENRSDVRRLRYIGEAGVEVTDMRVVTHGGVIEGSRARIKFTQAGPQMVTLTVTDDLGAMDTREIPVLVRP